MNPNPAMPEIDTVAQGTSVLVSQHRSLMTGVWIAAAVLEVFIFWFWYVVLGNHRMLSLGDNDGSIFLFLIPLSIPAVLYAYWAGKARRLMLGQIAASLGYSYAEHASLESISGIIFSHGHSRKIYDVLLGTYRSYPVRLFSYEYTVQEGKHSHTYTFTVCELTYPAALPHIVVLHHEVLGWAGADMFSGIASLERTELEGDFGTYFDVYAEQNAQIQIREILEPEVMERLIDVFKGSSIEINANKIYLMQGGTLSDRAGYLGLHERMGALIDDIIPGLRVAAADEAAEHAAMLARESSAKA